MRLVIISTVIVLAVAVGLLMSSGALSGFFASYDETQLQDDAIGIDDSDSPDFGLSLRTQPRQRTTTGTDVQDEESEETEDELPATEENETPTVVIPGGGSGGGSSGGGSSGGGSGGGNPCKPTTCANLGYSCGSWPDGCGGTLQCGTCQGGFACSAGTCEPQLTAAVSVSPGSSEVSVNDIFSVDVEIDTDSPVYAVYLKMGFDENVLQATDISEGNFLDSDAQNPIVLSYDNDAGEIEYAQTRISPQDGKSGSGTLITVDFEAISSTTDTTEISLEVVDIVDENIEDFTVDKENGVVKVNA
ncbi:MAG: hypothetical protein JSV63_01875 [Candidatus Aenigmatarchaeota archaeon]|nr:MAG: hypothetical protein JSV63_01875 [Candidatus Aenigmarchaeota archaeon]